MRKILWAGAVAVASVTLAGCPCGPQEALNLEPLSEALGYTVSGPYFEGRLTKANPDDEAWVLEGRYIFPNPGYRPLGPEVQVGTSDPELVHIGLRYLRPDPGQVYPQVISEVPVHIEVEASNHAEFKITIQAYCTKPPPPAELDCEQPEPISVEPLEDGPGYRVEGARFQGTLLPETVLSGPTDPDDPNAPSMPWELDGVFTFPYSGFEVLEPDVQVAESYPEQVTITLTYVDHHGMLPVVTEKPVIVHIPPVSLEAAFRVQVEACEEVADAAAQ